MCVCPRQARPDEWACRRRHNAYHTHARTPQQRLKSTLYTRRPRAASPPTPTHATTTPGAPSAWPLLLLAPPPRHCAQLAPARARQDQGLGASSNYLQFHNTQVIRCVARVCESMSLSVRWCLAVTNWCALWMLAAPHQRQIYFNSHRCAPRLNLYLSSLLSSPLPLGHA